MPNQKIEVGIQMMPENDGFQCIKSISKSLDLGVSGVIIQYDHIA